MNFPVSNASIGDIEYTDFDEFVLGDYSTTVDDTIIYRVSGIGVIAGSSEDKILKFDASAGTHFVNFSGDSFNGSYIDFNTNTVEVSRSLITTYIEFYNETGSVVVRFRLLIDMYVSDSYKVEYYKHDTSYAVLYLNTTMNTTNFVNKNMTLRWIYNYDNIIQYSLYDGNGNLLGMANDTAVITGQDFYDESQFLCNKVKFTVDNSVAGYGSICTFNVYEIGSMSEVLEGLSGLPEVTGISVYQDGTVGIRDTEKLTTVTYTVYKTGDDDCRAWLRIYKPDGSLYYQKLMLSNFEQFNCYYTTEGTYTFTVTDYFNAAVYNESTEFDVTSTTGYDAYETLYGAFFSEWYDANIPCSYNKDEYGKIIYHVNDSYINASAFTLTGITPYYYIEVINEATNDILFNSKITTMNETNIITLPNAFPLSGSYIIRLYNATILSFFPQIYFKDFLVYESHSLIVCGDIIPPAGTNTYSYSLYPVYNTYEVNDTMKITVNRLTGTKPYTIELVSPTGGSVYTYLSYVGNTFTYDVPSFSSYYADYHDAIGLWFVNVYDSDGSSSQTNALHVSISVSNLDEQGKTPSAPFLPTLSQPLGSIVGLLITMFCLLSPFLLAGALNGSMGTGINPPLFVYAISGGLGIAISTILGLFPSWIVFFIIAIGIIIIFLMYFAGILGNGGGE